MRKVRGEPQRITGGAQRGVKAVGCGMVERGAQAAERPEAGSGQVGDAGLARPAAATNDQGDGLGGQRGDDMFDQRLAVVEGQSLVAAEAGGGAPGEDGGEDFRRG